MFLAVRIAAQNMLAPEARAERAFFIRIIDRDPAPEQIRKSKRKAANDFDEGKGLDGAR
jgi:hypothetical protein